MPDPKDKTWYKVLRRDGSTKTSRTGMIWSQPVGDEPGEWHAVAGNLVLCENGLHLTSDPFAVGDYNRDLLFVAEFRGETLGPIDHELVCREARLLRRIEWSSLMNDDHEFVAERLRRAGQQIAAEIKALQARAARDLSTACTLRDTADKEATAARLAHDRAVKIAVTEGDSPAYALLQHVWTHEGHGQGKSWRRLNAAMQDGLRLAITCGMEFYPRDFARFADEFNSGYWISDGEVSYARACGASHHFGRSHGPNASAIQSFERWTGRKPFLVVERSNDPKKVRLYVGQRFYWHEDLKKEILVTVTSFHDGIEPHVVACSYKDAARSKVERVFKITHQDIKDYHKAIRDHAKAAMQEAEERSLEAAEGVSGG